MRTLIPFIVLIAATAAFAQVRPDTPVLDGSWRSTNVGLDFPIWIVETYNADGTLQVDFYSRPKDLEIHHKDKTRQARWRIVNNTLEVGTLSDTGEFETEGRPRPITADASGKIVAIDDWTRRATTAADVTAVQRQITARGGGP